MLREVCVRFSRSGLFILLALLNISVYGQQNQPLTTQTQVPESQQVPLPAPKDAQAVSIVNQVLTIAGGNSAILAVGDYTASGAITYHQNQDVQGTIILSALGLSDFREDANLPTGLRSFAISNGQPSIKDESGDTKQLDYKYQIPLMTSSIIIPYWQLAAAVNDPLFALSYKGTTEIDGYTVHVIRVQLVPPGPPDPNGVIAEYFGADFFIDTTNFLVRMTQDVVIRHFARKIRYSNYKPTNGVLIPFSIEEEINGQPARTIRLTQIVFNSGLQQSAFGL
jgi:hypothetical protein